jgi:protein-tyrosine phosphatase
MFRPDSGPVEIIPKLYLGNQKDSSDLICLQQLNITHILNVTHNIPNLFENMDKFRYLTLPVEDNSDGNMMDLFPKAFDFIDAALSGTGSVLVHCVGGISRSSTIIIAYLMFKQNYTLNDAYDFVKVKKPNVAPNFNFMGQLLDLETSRTSLQINPPQTSPSIEYTDTATRMLLVANSNNQAKMIVIDQCSSPGSSSSSGSEMTSTSSLSSSAASSLSFNLPNDFKSFQSDL